MALGQVPLAAAVDSAAGVSDVERCRGRETAGRLPAVSTL